MSSDKLVLEVGKYYTVRDPEWTGIVKVRVDAIRKDITDDGAVAATDFYIDGSVRPANYTLDGSLARLAGPSIYSLVAEYDPTALTDKDVEYQELIDKVLLLEAQVRDLELEVVELRGAQYIPATMPLHLGPEHVGMRVRLRSGEVASVREYIPETLQGEPSLYPVHLRTMSGYDIITVTSSGKFFLGADDSRDVVEILD